MLIGILILISDKMERISLFIGIFMIVLLVIIFLIYFVYLSNKFNHMLDKMQFSFNNNLKLENISYTIHRKKYTPIFEFNDLDPTHPIQIIINNIRKKKTNY